MDYRKINLSDKNKVTLFVDLKPLQGYNDFLLVVFNCNGDVLYRRFINKNKVMINLPTHCNNITLSVVGAKIDKYIISDLVPNDVKFNFIPEVNRNVNAHDLKICWVEDLKYTPANIRISNKTMTFSNKHFREYDQPTRYFIMLHELGHVFCDSEEGADKFALYWFLKKGYNLSSAYNALKNVLRKNKESIERMFTQMEDLVKTSNNKKIYFQ